MNAFMVGILIGMAFEIGWILYEIRDIQKEIKLLRAEIRVNSIIDVHKELNKWKSYIQEII